MTVQNPPLIQVLLSTWNGERWLGELLDSLSRQTYPNWQLLIRDDGSQDQTIKILVDWQKKHPDRIADLMLFTSHVGSKESFSRLVEKSTASYLMFCDQDDVWFPEKIEMQYAAMFALEAEHGVRAPALVHSDLAVVDASKKLLTPSFWEYQGANINQSRQAYLLTNPVTGCATLFNRSAADLAFPLPKGAIQHDRWLALVCAWFGHVQALSHPTVLYRQHGNNQIGALNEDVPIKEVALRVNQWSRQAAAFNERYDERLSAADQRTIAAVAALVHLKGWERRKHILQHRLFKQSMMENLALLLFS